MILKFIRDLKYTCSRHYFLAKGFALIGMIYSNSKKNLVCAYLSLDANKNEYAIHVYIKQLKILLKIGLYTLFSLLKLSYIYSLMNFQS